MLTIAPRAIAAEIIFRYCGVSFLLVILLLLPRGKLIGIGWTNLNFRPAMLLKLSVAAFYDVILVVVMLATFVLLSLAFCRSKTITALLYTVYSSLCLLVLFFAICNIKIVEIIGSPLTYQWFYYSDALDNTYMIDAVQGAISYKFTFILTAMLTLFTAGVVLIPRWTPLLSGRYAAPTSATLGCAAALCAAYIPLASVRVADMEVPRAKLVNPISEFFRSAAVAPAPELFTMHTRFGPDDVQIKGERAVQAPAASLAPGDVRNVLIFVLESVGARYIETYGGEHPVTPTLSRARGMSLQFDRIYAHLPATNASLFTLLTALYPMISFRSITEEHPDIAVTTLPDILAAQGYRTSFFASGDFRFQSGDKFLARHSFDHMADYSRRTCDGYRFSSSTEKWKYFDSWDDQCTAAAFVAWLDQDEEKSFFSVVWTNMTHFPYFMAGEETNFGVDSAFYNRYLNALRFGDAALGHILQGLAARGKLDTTLVIVVGDHGEAFGQHGQFVHGKIYEETIHIPLVMINPLLFHGERIDVIGGLVDIAPTILDILGIEPPCFWQGRSLLDTSRSPRVYFFSPWDDYLFGFREGDLKYILNATANEYEVYDLRDDPEEQANLFDGTPESAALIQERLAAWVQYQQKLMARLLSRNSDASGPDGLAQTIHEGGQGPTGACRSAGYGRRTAELPPPRLVPS